MNAVTTAVYNHVTDSDSLFRYAQQLMAECITAAPNQLREHVVGLAQSRNNFALSVQQAQDADWFVIVQEIKRQDDVAALFAEPCYCPGFGGTNG